MGGAVPHVHWTSFSQNLSLKVDFLFQSFLVLTVYQYRPELHVFSLTYLGYNGI